MCAEDLTQPEQEELPPARSIAAAVATSALDEPVEAIVYDVHPALAPPGQNWFAATADYPYGPPSGSGPAAAREPFTFAVDPILASVGAVLAALNRPPDFVVPRTFGMSAILGITTALAVLFGFLRLLGAWPVFYLFFGIQIITICLAQMFYGKAPRVASVVAGTIFLPLFTIVSAVYAHPEERGLLCVLVVPFVPCGALLGYLTGTCAAGIFLVMDYLEPYLQGQRAARASQPSSPASAT
jgi:hypothetical protein